MARLVPADGAPRVRLQGALELGIPDGASLGTTPLQLRDVPGFSTCTWRNAPVRNSWPDYTLAYYPNTSAFGAFIGDDLTPWNDELYLNPNWHDNLKLVWDHEPNVMCQRCALHNDDGSTWHVHRVGPFTSTGATTVCYSAIETRSKAKRIAADNPCARHPLLQGGKCRAKTPPS